MSRCIVIDDEPMALSAISNFIERCELTTLLHSFSNPKEALLFLSSNSTDLIFLDVEMPGMTGLEFIDQLTVVPDIILTTSKREYALDAFEYNVVDYLLKPIKYSRFTESIFRLKENLAQPEKSKVNHNLYVKNEGKYLRLDLADILYFENIGDYVKVVTTKNNYVIHSTLKNLYTNLDKNVFVKVHRSYIVNMNKIVDIEDNSLVIENKVIPISRANKPILMSQITYL